MFGAQKGAGQIGVERTAPRRQVNLGSLAHRGYCANIVECHIEAPEAIDGRAHECARVGFIDHITRKCNRFSAGRSDLGDECREFGLAARADHDLSPFACE